MVLFFAGWQDQNGGMHNPGDTITISQPYATINLTAQWEIEFIGIVSYELDGGSGYFPSQSCRVVGSEACEVTIPTSEPTKTDYRFTGWKNEITGEAYSAGAKVYLNPYRKDVTLTAQWELKLVGKVEYNLNGASEEISEFPEQTCTDETGTGTCKIQIYTKTPTRFGYRFSGWKDQNENYYFIGNWVYLDSATPTVTLTAQWEQLFVGTVKYALDGANESASEFPDQTCTSELSTSMCNITIHSLKPTKTGHNFMGWKSQIDSSYEPGDSIGLNSMYPVFTLTAQWEEDDYGGGNDPDDGGGNNPDDGGGNSDADASGNSEGDSTTEGSSTEGESSEEVSIPKTGIFSKVISGVVGNSTLMTVIIVVAVAALLYTIRRAWIISK